MTTLWKNRTKLMGYRKNPAKSGLGMPRSETERAENETSFPFHAGDELNARRVLVSRRSGHDLPFAPDPQRVEFKGIVRRLGWVGICGGLHIRDADLEALARNLAEEVIV